MKKILITMIVVSCFALSCKKKCDCMQDYDPTTTYVKGDLVKFDGKCWKAEAQGRGITPGPWMQNGNDIWKECD